MTKENILNTEREKKFYLKTSKGMIDLKVKTIDEARDFILENPLVAGEYRIVEREFIGYVDTPHIVNK